MTIQPRQYSLTQHTDTRSEVGWSGCRVDELISFARSGSQNFEDCRVPEVKKTTTRPVFEPNLGYRLISCNILNTEKESIFSCGRGPVTWSGIWREISEINGKVRVRIKATTYLQCAAVLYDFFVTASVHIKYYKLYFHFILKKANSTTRQP